MDTVLIVTIFEEIVISNEDLNIMMMNSQSKILFTFAKNKIRYCAQVSILCASLDDLGYSQELSPSIQPNFTDM